MKPEKPEYDFSKAEQGRFFHEDLVLVGPIYLEPEIERFLASRAKKRGVTLSELVNELLQKDIELIEMAGEE